LSFELAHFGCHAFFFCGDLLTLTDFITQKFEFFSQAATFIVIG
jgi:hypothetical protein